MKATSLIEWVYLHPLPSLHISSNLVPRPRPAFHRLQYGVRARGEPGKEATYLAPFFHFVSLVPRLRLLFCMLASTLPHCGVFCGVLDNESCHVVYVVVLIVTFHVTIVTGQSHILPPAKNSVAVHVISSWADSDLFLERRVHSCLSALLAIYCREEVQRSLDFDLSIPGLDSFQDL